MENTAMISGQIYKFLECLDAADGSEQYVVCADPDSVRRRCGGAFIWFFFSEPVKAADARRLGTSLLTKAMRARHELPFASYDQLFPAQSFLTKGGFGNLIALPFQGRAQENGNTLFIDESFIPYPGQ